MKDNSGILKKIFRYCNKYYYSIYYLFISAVLFSFICYVTKINYLVFVFAYLINIIIWFIKLVFIPKNNSNKYGILFLIDNSVYYNETLNLFFKKLKFILEDNFKIYIFNKNFFKKFDTLEKKEKILNKKKYQMLINCFALEGKEASENVCSLNNKDITFMSPMIDETTLNNLQKEFDKEFKKIIKLREKDNYIDINENADLLSISIRYFVCIIYIMFNQLDKAENELKSLDFNNLPVNSKIVQYLRRGVVKRFIDIYLIRIYIKINEMKYLHDESELENIELLQKKLQIYIDSVGGDFDGLYNYLEFMAKIKFANQDYNNSLAFLNRMHKKEPNDYCVLLSMAFININMGNIPKGIELYKRVSRRQDVDNSVIEKCIDFTDSALKNRKNNLLLLSLCKGLLLYYWIDKDEGKKLIFKIHNDLDTLNDSTGVDIKKYIEVRYLK